MMGVTPASSIALRVIARDVLADQVVGLTLAHPEGQALPAWTAGAHIDLMLENGVVRQYSLCGDAADRNQYRIAVLRQDPATGGRGGSCRVHGLDAGATIEIAGPRNHFALQPSPRYLFIAGGIGVTPILPMLDEATASGAQWQCVYGGRNRASMAFTERLRRHGGAVRLTPQDESGLLDLEALLCQPRDDTRIYCCGPESLLQAVTASCERYGWKPGSLHVERFAAAPPSPDTAVVDTPFEVVLARSGLRVAVGATQSVLEALDCAGVPVPFSCGAGVCGTCETAVLEGRADHRDAILSDEERASGQTMMICVSRSHTSCLVLDLRIGHPHRTAYQNRDRRPP